MKSSIILGILILVVLTVSGCQEPYTIPADDTPIEERSIIDIPGFVDAPEEVEEIEEEGIPDETLEEVEETEEETEETEEEVEEAVEQNEKVTIELKLNEPYVYDGKTITILSHRDGTSLEFSVDNFQSKFRESRTSEIINNLRITYEQSFYTKRGTVQISIEPFVLGENEYLLTKREKVQVGTHNVVLNSIEFDSRIGGGIVSLSLSNEDGYISNLKRGETKKLGDELEVTLIQAYWRSMLYYAHLKIE